MVFVSTDDEIIYIYPRENETRGRTNKRWLQQTEEA
jgi:hypothetical protein